MTCGLLVALLGLLGLDSCKTSKNTMRESRWADKRMGDVRVLYGGPSMKYRSNPLIIIDGEESGSIDSVESSDVDTIVVKKGDAAVEEYGEKARGGVIIVKTKK